MAISYLHTLRRSDNTPDNIMHSLHRSLWLAIQRRLLMSGCCILINSVAGKLLYVYASHPYHHRAATGKLEKRPPFDPIFGGLKADFSSYEKDQTNWGPGDVLVMYTDGVTQEHNGKGEEFSHACLQSMIAEIVSDSSLAIDRVILDAVAEHVGSMAQSGDVTLVVAKALERDWQP